jgi:L-amino acid N-acyltransferase YncA
MCSSRTRIQAMTAEHAAQVLAIYQAGIDEGQATFEESAPTWQVFDAAKLAEHRNHGVWRDVVLIERRSPLVG